MDHKARIFGDKWLNLDKFPFSKPVDFYMLHFRDYEPSDSVKVLYLSCEPRPIRISNSHIIKNKDKFDLILTYDDEILASCSNARFSLFGTSWLSTSDGESSFKRDKKFGVSFLCGSKSITSGHLMRHELWKKQDLIQVPKTFYNSSASPMANYPEAPVLDKEGNAKLQLMEYQFSVVIENSKENGYFSEKIVDTLVCGTVPIYWGCGNIGNFVDSRGVIEVDNVDEIIQACNSLNENTYKEKLEFIKSNINVAERELRDLDGGIAKQITDFIGRQR